VNIDGHRSIESNCKPVASAVCRWDVLITEENFSESMKPKLDITNSNDNNKIAIELKNLET
jgi:hypothetical protein